jgi:hypothetical protein
VGIDAPRSRRHATCRRGTLLCRILDYMSVIPRYFQFNPFRVSCEISRLSHGARGTRSTSSDDVLSGTVMTVVLSGYWLGATFTVKLAG